MTPESLPQNSQLSEPRSSRYPTDGEINARDWDPRGKWNSWPESMLDALSDLWNWRGPNGEQHSTAEIGRRLGVTKNAAVGKAGRLGLPRRPSPIGFKDPLLRSQSASAIRHRARNQGLPPPPRAPAQTLPPLASLGAEAPPTPPTPPPVAKRVIPAALNRPLAPAPAPPAAPRVRAYTPPPISGGRVTDCCWPIGEPGTKAFHFCDSPSEAGRPYCAVHVKAVYVKIVRRAAHRDDGYARPVQP